MIKLRRIISSESWVPEIDGLRFVAIMAVLLFHAWGEVTLRGLTPLDPHLPHLTYVLGNGDRGVGLFFVISGFVLARPFFAQHRLGGRVVSLPKYFLRRLTRLEPPFLLCMAIYCVAWIFVMHFPVAFVLSHTLLSSLYLHTIVHPYTLPFPNFVTWSLEVEVQFYILAPLLGQIYRIHNTFVRRSVWAVLMLSGCVWSFIHPLQHLVILEYAGFFPAGFLLADLYEDPNLRKSRSFLWDIVGVVGWVVIFTLPHRDDLRGLLPLVILPVCFAVFQGRALRWIFQRPLLTTIGGMCYSIYLMHQLTYNASLRVAKHLLFASPTVSFFVQIAMLVLCALAVGLVYFVLIERPCMNKRWPQELLDWLRAKGHFRKESAV